MIEIFIFIFIGIVLGIFTGLTPGVHINLVAVLILSLSPWLLNVITPLNLTIIIIAMSITHTFLDAIPSIFLGCPSPDSALLLLPGHKLLLEGKGYYAVILTLIGSLGAIIFSISSLPLTITIIKIIYQSIQPYIGYILLIICAWLIIREKQKLLCLITFLLAGTLGLVTLNLTSLSEPLFPLFSGMFGISMLIISMNTKTIIPPQTITQPFIEQKAGVKIIVISSLVSILCSILPGIGPSQAAIITTKIISTTSQTFLIITGALNTANMIASIATLYIIEKARNGSIVVVSKLIEQVTLNHILIYASVSLIVCFFATVLTITIAKGCSNIITKINYKKVCMGIMIFIILLVAIISKASGIIILLLATAVGLIPQLKNIPKNHLMGCILLPTIVYFL